MKNYLVLLCTLFLSFKAISQCAVPKTIPYIENFSTGTPTLNLPECSKSETLQNYIGNWKGYPNLVGGRMETEFCCVVNGIRTWWFSPKIQVEVGKAYRLSINFGGMNNSLEINSISCNYGTCDSSICMTNPLSGAPLNDQLPRTLTKVFTPGFNGTINLGLFYRGDPTDPCLVSITNVSLVEESPAPVTMGSLTAQTQGNNTNLYFQTYTEQNNKGFYVEQSTNGQPFTSLGFIPSKAANGNSILPLSYQYSLNGIAPAQFRLKQQDFNGAVSYSNIALVTGKVKGFAVTVLPNPVINNLQASIYSPTDYKGMVQIVSSTGRQVHSQAVNLPAGFSSLSILANNWPAGSYFIKVNGVVTRFIK